MGSYFGKTTPRAPGRFLDTSRASLVISGMNGVAMARNGLILWENDARRSRKVFKYLPDLWEAIKKMLQKSKNEKMS